MQPIVARPRPILVFASLISAALVFAGPILAGPILAGPILAARFTPTPSASQFVCAGPAGTP